MRRKRRSTSLRNPFRVPDGQVIEKNVPSRPSRSKFPPLRAGKKRKTQQLAWFSAFGNICDAAKPSSKVNITKDTFPGDLYLRKRSGKPRSQDSSCFQHGGHVLFTFLRASDNDFFGGGLIVATSSPRRRHEGTRGGEKRGNAAQSSPLHRYQRPQERRHLEWATETKKKEAARA